MGSDKATLLVAGGPLWLRQLNVLRNLQPDKILISSRVRPTWAPDDIEVVIDDQPSQGPLSGLTAALRHLHTTHLLALAIDLPNMTTEHLLKLWRLALPGTGVIPQQGNYYEPLAAIYPAAALPLAEYALATAQLSLQSLAQNLLERNSACLYSINENDRHLYQNINSPDDLKTVR
jgi:molybdopterin-guanine dinucleotide biosynthesis protein A